jgi:hypothetical protein
VPWPSGEGDHGDEIQKASENLDDFEVSGRGSDEKPDDRLRERSYVREWCGLDFDTHLHVTTRRFPDVTRAP